MGKAVVGLVLIFLAIVVVVAGVLSFSSSEFRPPPPDRPADPDRPVYPDERAALVVTLGEGEPVEAPRKTYAEGLEESAKGDILPDDWKNVDKRGYLNYTVKRGETLSSIADKFLGRRTLWTLLIQHNPKIGGPTDLREGTVLKIPIWLRER